MNIIGIILIARLHDTTGCQTGCQTRLYKPLTLPELHVIQQGCLIPAVSRQDKKVFAMHCLRGLGHASSYADSAAATATAAGRIHK